jgi:hypothetical protein
LRRAHGDLGENLTDVGGGDRLQKQRRHGGDIALPHPSDDGAGELVKLRGALNRDRNGAGTKHLFLQALAGVVRVALDSIDAHDRQQHVMLHLRTPKTPLRTTTDYATSGRLPDSSRC